MWLTDFSQRVAGDIAFYKGQPGLVLDELIMLRTGSPYVHVAICTGPDSTIAATSGGITLQGISNVTDICRTSQDYESGRLAAAMDWLVGQVGKAYGYADVVNQVLLSVAKDPILLDKSADCSDLATRFLWIAGLALPAALIETNRVTPGMLQATLGSLP